MQLDDQPHTREGVVLFGDTALIGEIARDGATQALARFVDAHQRYRERARVEARDRLLTAAVGAQVGRDARRLRPCQQRLARRCVVTEPSALTSSG